MGDVLVRIRPIKIIAEILSVVSAIWLIVSIAGPEWVDVRFRDDGSRVLNWGIWLTCNTLTDGKTVCMEADWVTVCLVFSIIALILCLASSICGVLGLVVAETVSNRRIFYLGAGTLLLSVALLELMVVIIFPVKFNQDILSVQTVQRWDYDWTYGFAWGGFIFSVGAAVFFLLPVEKQEEEQTTATTYYSTRFP